MFLNLHQHLPMIFTGLRRPWNRRILQCQRPRRDAHAIILDHGQHSSDDCLTAAYCLDLSHWYISCGCYNPPDVECPKYERLSLQQTPVIQCSRILATNFQGVRISQQVRPRTSRRWLWEPKLVQRSQGFLHLEPCDVPPRFAVGANKGGTTTKPYL